MLLGQPHGVMQLRCGRNDLWADPRESDQNGRGLLGCSLDATPKERVPDLISREVEDRQCDGALTEEAHQRPGSLVLLKGEIRRCVYSMRMARVNVYLPEELAKGARSAGLNVSALTQDAVRQALATRQTDAWLDGLVEIKGPAVDVRAILASAREAKDELEQGRG